MEQVKYSVIFTGYVSNMDFPGPTGVYLLDFFCSGIQFYLLLSHIRVGYNLDIMRQSACLVLNPITVYTYGFLFNCTAVGQASDSMTALT